MSQKYRCPVCGATHKDLPEQCRLCGQKMGPEAAVGASVSARVDVEQKRGIGAIVGVVILLVVAIVAIAVLTGAVPGLKSIDAAKNKVGFGTNDDGWSRFDYPAGGFSVEFPEGDRKTDSLNDTYRAYTLIGKDTLLLVSAKPVMTQQEYEQLTKTTEGQTLKKRMETAADEIELNMKTDGVKIDKRTDSSAFGVPAVYLETRDTKTGDIVGLRSDAPLHSRTMLFIKDGVLYNVSVVSVYNDMPQFDRLLNTLVITGRPGAAPGSTTPT